MLVDGVAEAARHAVDRTLEPRVAERLDLAAVPADEVMVMVTVGRGCLVARDPVPGVDPLHQAEVDKGVERAIDGRDSDRTPGPS